MRAIIVCGFVLVSAAAQTPAEKLWTELNEKRDKLPGIHQEITVSRTYKTANGDQSSKWEIILDMAHGQWREESISGSGKHLRIFDGKDLFSMEEGGEEFTRLKRRPKDPDPVPAAYRSKDAEWSKIAEVERIRCGISGQSHECVVLDVPLKPWARSSARMLKGIARITADTETGIVLFLQTIEGIETERSRYQAEVSYKTERYSVDAPAEAGLFKLPSADLREVKELSMWRAPKIKKQLAGKPAPVFNAIDIQGRPVSLSSEKGKLVLLDFWTTWCPPCRADGPALDKLYAKYGQDRLSIIGISVSEDRTVVENFLKEHPHKYPIVLTTENELPSAYHIRAFPTYIIIDRDGTLMSAVEDQQGFVELRKLLKKAGLEVD